MLLDTPEMKPLYKFSDPRLPQFVFEWHVQTQKVYRIDVPGSWIDGEWVSDHGTWQAKGYAIAEHVENHGKAIGFVQTFCRGYLKAVVDDGAGKFGAYIAERILATDSCPIR